MCAINEFIDQKIVAGYFPGCVLLMGSRERIFFHGAFGFAMLEPEMKRMDVTTMVDIASITKPVATATSVLLLVERGLLKLETQVSKVLGELKGTSNAPATIFELLTHTSGLPAWYPLYLAAETEPDILRFIGDMEGGEAVYSCLDYILLGKVVERIAGCSLREFTEKEIFVPLGMTDTCFAPAETLRHRIAATERGNEHERKLSGRYREKVSFAWREEMIVGEVHDGNSFYCFGGVSGNAGLFSTAGDLARFAQALLRGGDGVLGRHLVGRLLTAQVKVEGDGRSTGFIVGGEGSGLLSASTVWHTGFTGCALWIDPESNIFIVFLSNAVHPAVKPNILKSIRPLIIYVCLDYIRKNC